MDDKSNNIKLGGAHQNLEVIGIPQMSAAKWITTYENLWDYLGAAEDEDQLFDLAHRMFLDSHQSHFKVNLWDIFDSLLRCRTALIHRAA